MKSNFSSKRDFDEDSFLPENKKYEEVWHPGDEKQNNYPAHRGNMQNRKDGKEKINLQKHSTRKDATWVPYLLIGLAVFSGLCLSMNLFCNWGNKLAENPSAHWMGYIGYYVCYALFGLFGPAAFLIPILFGILGSLWKNLYRDGLQVEKSIASALLLLSLSTVIQVFCLAILPPELRYIPAKSLIAFGAQMRGGGFIGGEVGYFFIRYFSVAGAIITSVFLFLLVVFFFLGMTPNHVVSWARGKKELKNNRKSVPGVGEMEEAWKQMSKKHALAQNPSYSLSIGEGNSALPPEGAVRSGLSKKDEFALPEGKEEFANATDEELAPIPMPILNTLDKDDQSAEDDLFIPEGYGNFKSSEYYGNADGKSPTEKALLMEEEYYKEKKKKLPVESFEEENDSLDEGKEALQEERADWIFPRNNEVKKSDKVQKADRNFELKNIFIELDDLDGEGKEKKHTEVPPEVPMFREHKEKVEKTTEDSWIFAKNEVRKPMDAWLNLPQTKETTEELNSFEDISEEEDFSVLGTDKDKIFDSFAEKAPEKKETPVSHTESRFKKEVSAAPSEEEEVAPVRLQPSKEYQFPSTDFLHPVVPVTEENKAEIIENINKLQTVLSDFRIGVSNITYSYGPTITRYEIFPAPGVRVRTVVNLADDISLCFAKSGVRMEAPIPGMSAIGVEVPNDLRCTVYLRDLLESHAFQNSKSKLTAGLGVDVTGKPILFDIAKMPHLLVAGATGMGKSVCINCMILSLLYRAKPEEVKLILIDPKKVEFSLYKAIPHLMAPIVTSPKDATGALQAAVEEMERRFELIEEVGVHDLEGYNEATKNDPDMPFLPQIVIIIDELADLMMTARDEVETAICRLAQKARAAGMHIIVGTQRPSVDVVTGLIKSNIPSRIACTVASQVDSRTILDIGGAEKLIGKGDMLFAPVGCMKPARVQGAFVDSGEVEKICDFIRSNNGTAIYDERFTKKMKEFSSQCGKKAKDADFGGFASAEGTDGEQDSKYMDALKIAVEENRVATSLLQRKLGIGYSRAAKLIDRMEAEGFVSKPDGTKPRNVLITQDQFYELYMKDGFQSPNVDLDEDPFERE